MTQPHLLEVSEVTRETLNISLRRSPCAPSSSGESWVRNPRSGQDNAGCSWGHNTRTGTERPWRCSVTHFPSTGTPRHGAAGHRSRRSRCLSRTDLFRGAAHQHPTQPTQLRERQIRCPAWICANKGRTVNTRRCVFISQSMSPPV